MRGRKGLEGREEEKGGGCAVVCHSNTARLTPLAEYSTTRSDRRSRLDAQDVVNYRGEGNKKGV